MKKLFFALIAISLPALSLAANQTSLTCSVPYPQYVVIIDLNQADGVTSVSIVTSAPITRYPLSLGFGGWTREKEISNLRLFGKDLSNGFSMDVQNSKVKGVISLSAKGQLMVDLTDSSWSYEGPASCQLTE